MDEDSLLPKEKAVAKFFLTSFGKNHLNLENMGDIDAKLAKRHLGHSLLPLFLFSPYLSFSIYILLLTSTFLADEMAPKIAMAEF